MVPDRWIGLLNFYIILASADELVVTDFDEQRLAELYAECPGEDHQQLDALAQKLVLEFQAQKANTEIKNSPLPTKWSAEASDSPAGEQEISDGALPIPMF